MRTNSKEAKGCRREVLMGSAFTTPETTLCRRRAAKQMKAPLNCERVEDSPFLRGLATELQSPTHLQEDFTPRMNLRYISQSSFLLLGYKQSFTYMLGRNLLH